MNARAPTPLRTVLAFTFLNSITTGVVTTGIAFLATAAYHFDAGQNYLLSAISGFTYTLGALAVGPVAHLLNQRFPLLGPRRLLSLLVVAMAVVAAAPAFTSHPWAPWILMAVYSPITGMGWPLIEAFLSGGRRDLEHAVVRFNVTWAGALAVGYWAMGPLLAWRPLLILVGVGALHLVSLAVVLGFAPVPSPHTELATGTDEGRSRRAKAQLPYFRALLPVSYVLFSAMTPILPTTFSTLGISIGWQAPLAATWMITRWLTFLSLGGWRGWVGRTSTAVAGGSLLAVGFALTTLASHLVGPPLGIALTVGGLVAFGVGMGIIYTGALTYALEAGPSEVESGGVHEALIGAGYTFGPAAGLLAVGAISLGWFRTEQLEPLMVGIASVVGLAIGAVGLQLARRGRLVSP